MEKTKVVKEDAVKEVSITAPKFKVAEFSIESTSPLVQLKFSAKARNMMMAKHEAGHQAKKGIKREPRNFQKEYEESSHKLENGKYGIPCAAVRGAMITACSLVGFKMTQAKLGIMIVADGVDKDEGTPLFEFTGEPEKHVMHVRNETGVCDIRMRTMWRKWSAKIRIKWDADMFNETDIVNLLSRAGSQVGILEGRANSKKSAGMGWGLFKIKEGGK
jgi:hypothetical protein